MIFDYRGRKNLSGKPIPRKKLFGGGKLNHHILELDPKNLVKIVKSLYEDLSEEAEKIYSKHNLNVAPSIASIEDEGRIYIEDLISSKKIFAEQFYGKDLVIETYVVYHNYNKQYNFLKKVDGAQLRISDSGDEIIFETFPLDKIVIPFGPAIKNLEKYLKKG